MPSTLSDFGRNSERFGDIPYYYSFPVKFWFRQNMLVPDDVLTWCRDNCTGYYKVVCYTHEDSVRKKGSKEFDTKIMYVDKVYLEKEEDAAIIKLTFEVSEQQVKRPKLKAKKKPRKYGEAKAKNASTKEAIAAATRKHAQAAAKKAAAAAARKVAAKKTAKK